MKKPFLQFAKSAWLLLVIFGALIYLSRNYESTISLLQAVSPIRALISLMFIAIGRILTTWLALEATAQIGWKPSFKTIFRIFWIAEPGKYLPGGIWHFVGRAGAYHTGGVPMADAGKALLIENLWLAISSALFGSLLFVAFSNHPLRWIASVALVILWLVLLILLQRVQQMTGNFALLFFLQITIWLLLGTSYVILLPLHFTPHHFAFGLAAFCISWLVGFITPFAPGGIGTREAALIGLVATIMPGSIAILYATIHRIFWIAIEVLYALIASALWRIPAQE